MPPDPGSFLPLKPLELELLLALSERELHGYGLVQDVARRSGGVITLEPGNLYRVIKRLLTEGLVVEAGHRPAEDLSNERRRYYRLTALGGRVLAAELMRLTRLVTSPSVRALTRRLAT